MIKSNRDFKELARLARVMPQHAEGHICIDLTDPVTGRVKERIEGRNHVFTDILLSESWQNNISNMLMCLNDDGADVDINQPYLRGNTVGYGQPSQGSSGIYRGAANMANQLLGVASLESCRWVFQYEFSTTQALSATIRNVGLTRQYLFGTGGQYPFSGFPLPAIANASQVCCDGRYAYSISSAGVITITDIWVNTVQTIDVSSFIGTNASDPKMVGYAPDTEEYFVQVQSSTSSRRKLYRFADRTFSTLLQTYDIPNYTVIYPFFVRGAKMFGISYPINRYDLSTNVLDYVYPFQNVIQSGVVSGASFEYGIVPFGGRYFIHGQHGYTNAGVYMRPVFDLVEERYIAVSTYNSSVNNGTRTMSSCNPVTSVDVPMVGYNRVATGGLTAHKLATPITKPSDKGMIATYELEVFWE